MDALPAAPAGDHPRAGGEKEQLGNQYEQMAGSPPRRRGKVGGGAGRLFQRGITPAQAGKSILSMWSVCCCRDHPRAGGEKLSQLAMGLVAQGSPPRRRGKGPGSAGACARHGITPAQAGKKHKRPLSKRPVLGSPPRRRGKGRPPCSAASRLRDHPRAGGEKTPLLHLLPDLHGSPPRRRGKACGPSQHTGRQRITPAQAGKSSVHHLQKHPAQDHPRAGGEKFQFPDGLPPLEGSPPRRRGKVFSFRSLL